jgi:3-dehydroquinate dehydratase / shikimate dehydrogenase
MKMGKVCASVSAETSRDAISQICKAEEFADLIEIRFDHLRDDELPLLLEYLRSNGAVKPLIATYRAPGQGGRGPASANERKEFWKRLDHDLWAVDLEEDVLDTPGDWPVRILSFHDFDAAGGDADEVFSRLIDRRPNVLKYAYHADDVTDTLPVWKMLQRAESVAQPVIAIAMGEAGKITRILGPAYGSLWSYGSIETETAPGQISVRDLTSVFRVPQLDRETCVYGVIGDPVSRSRSPAIHNAAFAEAGLNSVFVPLLVKDIEGFIQRMVRPATREVDLNFGGFAVTMPHKLSIVGYLDEIDETVKAIGAVNTVVIRYGRLHGHNTDAEGFIRPLLSRLGSLSGARAAVFGAGGAARACIYALKREEISVTVFARDPSKASKIANEFGVDSAKIGHEDLRSYDVVVNATPVGMNDAADNIPFSLNGLERTKLVYDLVTTAEPTALIKTARKAGVETITGIEMLVEQAARQFEIWTGKKAPVDTMKLAARSSI